MNLFKKLIQIFLINQVSIWVANGACKDNPPVVTDATMTVILINETVVYNCTNGKEFSSGDAVIVSDCTSDGWYPVSATCSPNNLDVVTCSETPDPEPKDATFDSAKGTDLYRPYKCNVEKAWLSGRPIKVMPCRKGEWLTVYDICDEGCPVPRDCADVADLGLEEEGEYLVIPTGKTDGKIYSVHCLLNNTEENGGGSWTYIFRQGINDTKKTADEYKAGYGNESKLMGNYFVGLDFLAGISQNFSDRDIGQVMDILFYSQSNELLYYSTYGDFIVGTAAETYKLWSVGKYHGTAGDSMCPIVPNIFEFGTASEQTYRWWGVTPSTWPSIEGMHGNFLPYSMKWERLSTKMTELNYVEIRIRPIEIDREQKCPPMVGSDVSWVETQATIPYSRSIGTIITWKCIGEMFYEGEEGKERTKEGTARCEDGPYGPQWSKNITLPCRVKCPDNFVLLEDGLRCFYFSPTEAKGFINASLECQKINSTLAIMKTKTDLQKAEDSKKYIVNHAQRGTLQTELVFSFPEDIYNCSGPDKICVNDASNECVVVEKSVTFEYKSCGASFPFICEVPTNCPNGYKLYGFTCFRAVSGSTFNDGNKLCAEDGASLAYPPNNNVAKEMESKLFKDFSFTDPESQYFMGVNYWRDSWNKGDFTMDPNYEKRLDKESANKWKVLSVKKVNATSSSPDGVEAKYISVDLTYKSDVAVYALCQYPGPIDCLEIPKNATEHMTWNWDLHFGVGIEAFYQCDEGYFVGKNKSVSNQTLICYGMLAEWYPSLLPCERTPVCDKIPTVNSDKIKNTTNDESAYIGGNITYSCPADMAFAGRQQNLTVICNKTDNGFAYNLTDIPGCNYCAKAVVPVNMTSTWSSSLEYGDGDSVNVSCWEGYQYLTGAIKQKVNCTSAGWVWETTEPCYPMCSGNVSLNNATNSWKSGYFFIGSPGEMMCNKGFQFMNGAEKMNITCTLTGWNLTDFEGCFPQCTGPAEKGNAFSTWNDSAYYNLGSVEEMECKESYEFDYDKTTQNVTCAKDGWDLSKLKDCYAICENDPPTPGKNVKPINVTSRVVGSTISYQCETGYFPPIMANTKPSPNITIRCNESAEWTNPLGTKPYNCTELCLDDPPATPANGTSDWDKMNHGKNANVTYECDDGYFFGNYSTTWIVTCDGMSWGPMDTTNFVCSRYCDVDPPEPQTNEEYDFSTSFGKVGQNVEYKCKNFTANKDGNKAYKITCLDSGQWTSRPDDFLCEKGCGGPPISPPTGASWNYSGDFREGVVVQYNCTTNFMQFYEQFIYSTCSDSAWSLAEVPACPPDSPFTPVIVLDKNEMPYKDTADYQCSEIDSCFTGTEGEGTYQVVKGPPGFGVASGFSGTCRVKEGGFDSETEKCLLNPKDCGETGLSFCTWEKHFNYQNVLNDPGKPNNSSYWYIVSTGGDMNGHPGFALYHEQHYIVAVVSTGEKYWTVDAVAQSEAGCWVNIGVTWDLTNGIKLYFNATKFGESSYARSVTAKSSLNPPQIMMGCHKTVDDTKYSGFNPNSSLDEFSLWNHCLKDEKNNKEVLKFLGGYREIYATKSPDELSEIVKQINYSDPTQVASAANIATLVLDDKPSSSAQPTPSSGPSSTAQTPSDSDDDPEGIKFEKQVKVVLNFMNPATVMSRFSIEIIHSFMTGESQMATLMVPKNQQKWRAMQLRQDIYGATQMMETFRVYQIGLLDKAYLPNGTDSYCTNKDYNTIFNRACKMTMQAFQQSQSYGMMKSPSEYPSSYKTSWGLPYDVAGVFASIYSNEECQDRAVSVSTTSYDSMQDVVHLGINPAKMDPGKTYHLDSRQFSFNVLVDPAYDSKGNVDKTKMDCNPTKADLLKTPVIYKLEHLQKAVAQRKLNFHKDEINSTVAVRRCAVWNEKYSDYGVWDTSGCEVVVDNADYTKCACGRMGIYVVISEETEPKVIRPEPKWLIITKYVLYGLSAVAIIVYIFIVALAADLKDLLHVMGANLGFALLAGSAVIVVSDFDFVVNDRHMCLAIGTLLHFFYGAVGFWMLFLGYASFAAVLYGEIGGRIFTYTMVTWGGAILMTGVPFVAFGLHSLGTDLRCFISWDNEPKYVFFIPQIVFSFFAIFFAIVVICNLSTSAFRKENLMDDYGSFCRGAAVLLILLGVTWTFGFLNFLRFGITEVDFDPIFQVLNASCGLCLLIFIGFGSNRFRMFILGKSKHRRKFVKTYAFGLPEAVEGEDTEYLTGNHKNR